MVGVYNYLIILNDVCRWIVLQITTVYLFKIASLSLPHLLLYIYSSIFIHIYIVEIVLYQCGNVLYGWCLYLFNYLNDVWRLI